jgi:hypothetical protein
MNLCTTFPYRARKAYVLARITAFGPHGAVARNRGARRSIFTLTGADLWKQLGSSEAPQIMRRIWHVIASNQRYGRPWATLFVPAHTRNVALSTI